MTESVKSWEPAAESRSELDEEVSIVRRRRREITSNEEMNRILDVYEDTSFDTLSVMLDRQFGTLHHRAHVLLFVCSVLITGSAFLGYRLRDETGIILLLRLCGGALAVGAAAVALMGVLRVEWITRFPGETREDWLRYALHYRNHKTIAYRLACWLTLASMMFYEVSVAAILFT